MMTSWIKLAAILCLTLLILLSGTGASGLALQQDEAKSAEVEEASRLSQQALSLFAEGEV